MATIQVTLSIEDYKVQEAVENALTSGDLSFDQSDIQSVDDVQF